MGSLRHPCWQEFTSSPHLQNLLQMPLGQVYSTPAAASMQAANSAGFLYGCIPALLVVPQSGFHFLFFFILPGLLASHIPSFVMSNASSIVTPFFLRHISAKRSSPMGPYFPFSIPTFQSATVFLSHMSMFASRMLKAVLEKTSRLPKKPYFTPSQFCKKAPVGGTGIK